MITTTPEISREEDAEDFPFTFLVTSSLSLDELDFLPSTMNTRLETRHYNIYYSGQRLGVRIIRISQLFGVSDL